MQDDAMLRALGAWNVVRGDTPSARHDRRTTMDRSKAGQEETYQDTKATMPATKEDAYMADQALAAERGSQLRMLGVAAAGVAVTVSALLGLGFVLGLLFS